MVQRGFQGVGTVAVDPFTDYLDDVLFGLQRPDAERRSLVHGFVHGQAHRVSNENRHLGALAPGRALPIGGWTFLLAGVHLGVNIPTTQRLATDIKLLCQGLAGRIHGGLFGEPVEDHADGMVVDLGRVFLGHGCQLPQKRQWHQTRDGSSRILRI